jgi:hypothetical protein
MRNYPNLEETDAYHTFLSSQCRLKYLHFVPRHGIRPARPFHFPALETFVSNPTFSSSIFASLPRITALGLEDNIWACSISTYGLDAMSSTLSQVRSLALFSSFFCVGDLEKVTGCLQSLETLHIALLERGTTNRLTKVCI